MKINWVIQTNLMALNQLSVLWNAVSDLGHTPHEAIVIPFSDKIENDLPDIGNMVIPYGSVKLIKICKHLHWYGVWFDDSTARVDVWNSHRTDMLNGDCSIIKISNIDDVLSNYVDDHLLFIRPLKDLKEFNGTVTTTAEIRKWMNTVYGDNYNFTADTSVCISAVKPIVSESRFFIVNKKVIDGSHYRIRGQKFSQPVTDINFLNKVQELADGWLPHECCVMDVAVLEDGSLKIIEFNGINGSGFYYHNIPKIVKAMSDFLIERYG